MYLHSILELYPDCAAAKEARAVMSTAHTAAGSSVAVAERTVGEKDAPEVLEKVGDRLAKGDEKLRAVGGHESSSIADQRAAERAIRHYFLYRTRLERLALVVRPRYEATRLVLRSRSEPTKPLVGYEIYRTTGSDEPSQLLGLTDSGGAIVLPRGEGELETLVVKNGRQLLARLPLIAGQQETLTARIVDDDAKGENQTGKNHGVDRCTGQLEGDHGGQ